MNLSKFNILILVLVIINSVAIIGLVGDNYGLFTDNSLNLDNHDKYSVYIGLGAEGNNSTYIKNLESQIDALCIEKDVPGYTLYNTVGFMKFEGKSIKQNTLVYVFDRIDDDKIKNLITDIQKIDEEHLIIFVEQNKVSAGVFTPS